MKQLSALVAVLLAVSPAHAVEWTVLGARAQGMGGAGVAVPQGPADNYWNPANLGHAESKSGFSLPVGAHFGITGTVLEGANDLDEIANNAALQTQANVDAALAKLGASGNGVRADAGVGLNLKIKKLAVFLNGFALMGALPQVDLAATLPAQIAAKTNNSKLVVKGANVSELGVGYGHELPFAEGLFLGGNLKLMQAKVGYADAFILREEQEFGDLLDKMKSGARTSSSFGVDLGALWDLERTFDGIPLRPRVGLTGRNLNNPKFKQPAAATAAGRGDRFTVNPQARFGAAISPFNWWNVATDLDMTKNLTTVDGVASRQWGLGSEFNVFNRSWINVPLRVGLQRNLADGRSGTMLTFGAGLNLAHFHVDASVALSPKKVRTQSTGKTEEFPREAAVGLHVGLLFGGERDDAPRGRPSAEPAPLFDPKAIPEPPQPVPTERVKEAMEKAQRELDAEAAKKP
ncbi:MAG: conjugal transfer protein TraF [Elusimicrobiota bacterium]|nr:conjugal transfer protein TraF [Elusimicrobiota bacterium]